MRAKHSWVWGASIALWLVAGCGFGTVIADLSQNSVHPPTLMVAAPIPRALYVVMTPDNVADAFQIRHSGHSVTSFRSFWGDTLRNTLRPYFTSVEIVSEPPPPSVGPCMIADVRVDGVEARDLPIGSLVYTTLYVQWAFAVRASESTEYVFSYAGNGVSDHAYGSLGEGFEQMTLSAMNGFMQRWTEDDVFSALRAASMQTAGGETDITP